MKAATIFLSAGEASGEAYGALLMAELRSRCPGARFLGMGGERMEALGFERIVRSEDVAVMGITEVVRHLPRIYREYRKLKRAAREQRPDVAVLIDFPDIHLKLAEEFKRLGIPVIFFVSPQLWAWKKGRIGKVRRFVDRMLVIFPFEEGFYRDRGVDAMFVGHPLADLPLPEVSRKEFGELNGLDAERMWVGLLPGSRMKEIRANLPEMLQAARLLTQRAKEKGNEGPQFVLPLAPTLTQEQRQGVYAIEESLKQSDPGRVWPRFVSDARAALYHSRGSIVASGTATVEAALLGNPFVVVYRVSPLTYAIAKRVVTVPHVAMVNLIANWDRTNRLVPELIQDDFRAERIVQELGPLLEDGPVRTRMQSGLAQVGTMLHAPQARETAIGGVASEVMKALGWAAGA